MITRETMLFEHWPETLAAALLLVGFFIALIIRSPFMHYLVISIAGLLCGRVLYDKHLRQPIFPFVLIVAGFFLGYMLGAVSASKLMVLVLFLVGLTVSYQAHKRGYVGFFKSAGFIK
ncbi:hypothetical protein J4207_01605 [Candidatus Woesearchaeota archaeon]|nr:hypothetical protein [Candidatus Woesearchaeota archaeon]